MCGQHELAQVEDGKARVQAMPFGSWSVGLMLFATLSPVSLNLEGYGSLLKLTGSDAGLIRLPWCVGQGNLYFYDCFSSDINVLGIFFTTFPS